MASQYGRYGYRRIKSLLDEAGWDVGCDRVQRIWRREGLKVPQKQRPRGRLWLNDGSCIRLRPERRNHVWSYDGSSGCACRLLPHSCSLPQMAGGSASALSLSRPAQASLTLRPAGLLNRLKRPLSRGSSPAGYPAEPLVSYQINRQLSGWNLPPLVIRAFGAHCQQPT